jgi:hypothetical protein
VQAIENKGSHFCAQCASDAEKFGGDDGREGVSNVDAKIVLIGVNMRHGSTTEFECQ